MLGGGILQSLPNSILRQCQLNGKKKFERFFFILGFKIYSLPSLQTQTASWFWISHFPLLQPVHVKLLHSVEAWKNWNTFLTFFSYYLNSVWKNMHLIKDNQLCKQLFYPQRYGDFFNFHFVIKVKYGNNKEKNIKAWHPIKNRF